MLYHQLTETFTHERDRTRVTIAPRFGGRIAQIEIHDGASWLPLLYEPPLPPEERDPLSWGSFVMAPWPNRIANGRFTFEGRTYQLPVNRQGHAIHGVGFGREWNCERVDDHTYELDLWLDDIHEWLGISHWITIMDDGVDHEIEIMGSANPYPAGCGWHPWFRRDVRPGSDVRVLVDADERYGLSDDRIPTGNVLLVDGDYDLRAYPPLGERRLDDCYRRVRDPMRVSWGDVEVTMTSSDNVTHAVVHTPEHAVCVEPQTCAIDAFNLEARGIVAGSTVVASPGVLRAWTEWRWRIGTSG